MGKQKKIFYVSISLIILLAVAFVLIFGYRPDANSLGALGSVSMDVVCIIILITLMLSTTLEKNSFNKTTELFAGLTFGTMVGLFFDFLNWAYDGNLKFGEWTYVFTAFSFCMASIVAAIFVIYLSRYLDEVYHLSNVLKWANVCAILNLISFTIAIVLALTKTGFDYTDGHYTVGALYDFVTIIPILTVILLTVLTIRYSKTIGLHDVLAVVGYNVLMICGAIVEAIYVIGTTYVAIALADFFVFLMLQNKLLEREKKNAELWMQKSNTDELSGFYNRHAYEEDLTSFGIEKMRDNFVYVSIDINGLKLVNDTLGHEAGDELILGASECLKQCFGAYGKLYRTGGDEFVALIYADDDQLEEIKKDVDEVFDHWSGEFSDDLAISCGYVSKKESEYLTIRQMASLADKRMYEAKNRYYLNKGINRRGQRDAHVALCALYSKIFKFNVTSDFYQIINSQNSSFDVQVFAESISFSIDSYIQSGFVHPDDVDMFRSHMKISYLRAYFQEGNEILRILYRRKENEVYKKALIEIIPANDYREDMQTLYVYEKVIE